MSEIKTGGLDRYGKVQSLNRISGKRVKDSLARILVKAPKFSNVSPIL